MELENLNTIFRKEVFTQKKKREDNITTTLATKLATTTTSQQQIKSFMAHFQLSCETTKVNEGKLLMIKSITLWHMNWLVKQMTGRTENPTEKGSLN